MNNYIHLLIIALIFSVFPVSAISAMEPADSTEAQQLYKKADDFWRDVQYDSSNFYYEKASSLYQKYKSWKNFIDCQKNMGINYRYLGNYGKAFAHLYNGLDAVSYLKESQDSLRAELYNSIGTIYYEKGNYDKAFKYYKDMLDINERVFGEKHINTGKSYQNVGLIYYRTGDYDKALGYLEKALSIWDSTLTKGNPYFANCYTNISNVYFSKEEYKKSIQYDEKALKIWEDKLGESHPYIAASYDNLADKYSYTGNYDKALEYDYKAMQIRRDFAGEESRDIAHSYTGIGNVFVKMGSFNNAAYFLSKAISVYKKTDPSNQGLAEAYITTGDLSVKEKDFSSAQAYYDSALYAVWPDYTPDYSDPDDLDKAFYRERILSALIGKGNAYFSESENSAEGLILQRALHAYNLASDAIEKLKSDFSGEESKLLTKSAYDVNQRGVLTALKLYDLKNDPGYIESAFRFSERNKAGILAESITETDVLKFAGLPDSIISEGKDLTADLTLYQTKLEEAEASNNVQAAGDNRNLLFETRRKYDELHIYLKQNFPDYYKLIYPGEISSTEEIRKLLSTDEAIVEYFTGDSSVTIFTLTKSSANAVTVNCDPGFFDRVKKLREALPKSNYINYLSSAWELYSKLIEPVENLLTGKKKLYIIPDYILSYLPFEALLSEEQPHRFDGDFSHLPYLINKYEISYQYSALQLKESLLRHNDNAGMSFAGFAPVSSGGLESEIVPGKKDTSLPETETEVRSIGDLFEEHNFRRDLYIKDVSTESALRSEKISGYKFIHLAAYGFINEEDPKLSGLVLYRDGSDTANDGILYARDVYNLSLNADLLVLSACEIVPGTSIKGEGIYALTRSFLYAGVDNMVVSLWLAADKSTSVLMTLFYKNILDGMDYSSALRKAKLDLIKGGVFSYPLEWSPFILIGR